MDFAIFNLTDFHFESRFYPDAPIRAPPGKNVGFE